MQGQQDPQYTQYVYNMNFINPAYAGSSETLSMNFIGRSQWVGVQGAPQTLMFNIHAPVGKRVGLGLSLISDQIGPLKEQIVSADFSYTIPTGKDGRLAFGLKAGFSFVDAPLQFVSTFSGGDTSFSNDLNQSLPNIGAGLYYYQDRFYIGASVPNLLKTFHFEKKNGAISRPTDELHYFFTTGYVFDLSERVKFKPFTLFKAVSGAPLSLDFSGNFLFNDTYEAGVSYRYRESFSGMFNVKVSNSLRIGYAYDHSLSTLANFNSGSHEVFLLFDFNLSKSNYTSPRFF